jgi:plastocyanin domain-containing protein
MLYEEVRVKKSPRWLCIALLLLLSLTAAEAEQKRVVVAVDKDGVQRVEVNSGEYFYDPNHIVVKVNIPVEMTIKKEPGVTPHDIVIDAPDAGIVVREDLGTEPKIIRFTPTKEGKYAFSCTKKFLFFKSHKERGMEGIIEVTR